MGDISRHRDIYLNTRGAIPKRLLEKCKLTVEDLTYLELGNYLTDVSQFRDPVAYLFAKRKVWRENILPKAEFAKDLIHVLALLAGGAGAIAGAAGYRKLGLAGGALGVAGLLVSNEKLAAFKDADDWIDQMLGTPIDRLPGGRRRTDAEYGHLGEFFRHFIEGITHLLFAAEVTNKVPGEWREIGRIPQDEVAAVFKASFTQYYPHEHTDQPPYVWDASKRARHPDLYGTSRRQVTLSNPDSGIMNAVDKHDIQYLSEQLTKLEAEWRRFKPGDADARRKALVRMGKILHGVEDWFFHSNVIEFVRLREFAPRQDAAEDGEAFVRRFILKGLPKDRSYLATSSFDERAGLQRRLYRRFRFPEYKPGDKVETGGVASKDTSTLRLDLVYPAFPSQLDTSHTLLGALENLEGKLHGSGKPPEEIPPWLGCVLDKFTTTDEGRKLLEEKAKARGVAVPKTTADLPAFAATATKAKGKEVLKDVLREWVPLVLTLLNEDERQRLVANVDPLLWTGPEASASAKKSKEDHEKEEQLKRHKKALEPKTHADSVTENNYERAIRMLGECGFLAARGQAALKKAFEIDRKAESFTDETPGSGGFLIQFAMQLQDYRDGSDAAARMLNQKRSIFDSRSDNGALDEIVGSHSLMSKDTVQSLPFFEDARVLASLASQSVLHLLLDEVSSPARDTGLDWRKVLQHFIRYPLNDKGWEAHALAFFRKEKRFPAFADLPELAQLRNSARLPHGALAERLKGTKATDLEEQYLKLEKDVALYRYL